MYPKPIVIGMFLLKYEMKENDKFYWRVQNNKFLEEKGFILRNTEIKVKRKYSFRRDLNPRSMDYRANSLPLSYLTYWWMGIKVAYIKYQIVCLQINQVYTIVTKWHYCEQFRTKCCVKIVATLALATTDVFLIKMLQ